MKSFPSDVETVDVLKKAQNLLACANIKLHKIVSNSTKVMDAFPKEERAKGMETLDLAVDNLPVQRSLGVAWNMTTDTLTFNTPQIQKPHAQESAFHH